LDTVKVNKVKELKTGKNIISLARLVLRGLVRNLTLSTEQNENSL